MIGIFRYEMVCSSYYYINILLNNTDFMIYEISHDSFVIENDITARQLIANFSLTFCVDGDCYDIAILKNTRIQMPLCNPFFAASNNSLSSKWYTHIY